MLEFREEVQRWGWGCRLRWGGCRRLWEAPACVAEARLGSEGLGRPAAPPPGRAAPVRPLGSDPSPVSWPRVSQETPAPGEGPCALGSSQGELSRPRLPGKRGRT